MLITIINLPASDVATQYKEPWQVEHVFSCSKKQPIYGPVYHQLDETIKCHVFCSFLALVLRKELDIRLEASGLDLE